MAEKLLRERKPAAFLYFIPSSTSVHLHFFYPTLIKCVKINFSGTDGGIFENTISILSIAMRYIV